MADPIEAQFFSLRNREYLSKALRDDFSRRGVQWNPQLSSRLDKTLQHYMGEVYENNGSQPIGYLNKEAIGATVTDFGTYLNRASVPSVNLAQTAVPSLGASSAPTGRLQEDTSSAFDRLQNERRILGVGPVPKNIPKFDYLPDVDEDETPALTLFEQAQKQRELEAQAQAQAQTALVTQQNSSALTRGNQAVNRFMNATDKFSAGSAVAAAAAEQQLVQRDINRIINGMPSFPISMPQDLMPLPPDQQPHQVSLFPQERQNPGGNPTIALPTSIRTREVFPQDNIIPHPDTITYKENEYNLFVNSADRDWVNNTQDSRYQFVVNFNPANNRQGFGLSPAAQVRFKNITRIELVKAILPAEGLDVYVRRKANAVTDTNNTDAVVNILSFPYVSVRVTELDNNNYGTNNIIDNTFGVLQYDANWLTESVDLRNDYTLSRGYLAMIPKFLKSQKVYSPTPLASLQKMTITFQRPDGTVLSTHSDALNIAGIIPSERLSGTTTLFGSGSGVGSNVINTQAVYTTPVGSNSEYYWIQTAQWFPRHLFNEGDRLLIGGLNVSSLIGNSNYNNGTVVTAAATTQFVNYMTQSQGLLISGIGYWQPVGVANSFSSGGYYSNGVTTCANSLGYANCLIVQAQYNDPSTGSTAVLPFGGSQAVNVALGQALVGGSNGALYTTSNARLINMSHQTQLVFRVITRDMDSTSMLRPDNL